MKTVVVIVGPTGVGKTKLSVELAKKLNGEVINGDSTQIYRDLNIATAKVTEEEKEGISHHLFDIRTINEDYTVYDYQKDCRRKIESLLERNITPILVGGTGLYIKSVIYDYKFEEGTIQRQYEEWTDDELYKQLLEVDPNNNIHKNNRKRLVRAYNYYLETGKPFSEKETTEQLIYPVVVIGLTTNREILYERINARVDEMLEIGLLDEAKKIYDSNIRTKAVMTPIGYKELFPYFDNSTCLEECIETIKRNSRRYAKRQYTWFRNQMKVTWFDVNFLNFQETVEEIYQYLITVM